MFDAAKYHPVHHRVQNNRISARPLQFIFEINGIFIRNTFSNPNLII